MEVTGLDEDLMMELPEGTVIITTQEEPEIQEDVRTKQYFAGLLEQSGQLWEEQSGVWNDIQVYCADGTFINISSFILASMSPVFKAVAASNPELTSVVLPDISRQELEHFMSCLWCLDLDPSFLNEQWLNSVLGVLCMDCVNPPKPAEKTPQVKVKARRKPGPKKGVSKPSMKVEIVEKKRSSTAYGLRTKLKRARFVDEVDPLENNPDQSDISDAESEEYKPMEEEEDDDLDDVSDALSDDEIASDDGNEDFSENIESIEGLEVDDELVEDDKENLTMFTVKVNPDGQAQVVSQEQYITDESRVSLPQKKPRHAVQEQGRQGVCDGQNRSNFQRRRAAVSHHFSDHRKIENIPQNYFEFFAQNASHFVLFDVRVSVSNELRITPSRGSFASQRQQVLSARSSQPSLELRPLFRAHEIVPKHHCIESRPQNGRTVLRVSPLPEAFHEQRRGFGQPSPDGSQRRRNAGFRPQT